MFYSRCSLIQLINAITLDQGATSYGFSTKVTGFSVLFVVHMLYRDSCWSSCMRCVLSTFSKDDDDDGGGDVLFAVLSLAILHGQA